MYARLTPKEYQTETAHASNVRRPNDAISLGSWKYRSTREDALSWMDQSSLAAVYATVILPCTIWQFDEQAELTDIPVTWGPTLLYWPSTAIVVRPPARPRTHHWFQGFEKFQKGRKGKSEPLSFNCLAFSLPFSKFTTFLKNLSSFFTKGFGSCCVKNQLIPTVMSL